MRLKVVTVGGVVLGSVYVMVSITGVTVESVSVAAFVDI
jgi:hypothetical protein